jgi:hypothetical protein
MDILSTQYSLNDFYDILQNGFQCYLPPETMKIIQTIEKSVSVIAENAMSTYSAPNNHSVLHHHHHNNKHENTRENSNKSQGYSTNRNAGYNSRNSSSNNTKHSKNRHSEVDELSWENVRTSFKTTKIEKKEGIDKLINEIRISLNKISNKNYDTQRDLIFQHIKQLIDDSDSGGDEEEVQEQVQEQSQEKEKQKSVTEDLRKIALAVFDIASTNKFYSEMYAQLYKELMELYPVYKDILDYFISHFTDSLEEIKFVDPNLDYDIYCQYNKQNDRRKATTVFITHLLKKEIIPLSDVFSIITHLQEKTMEYVDEAERLSEIEEITELLFLFLSEGCSYFVGHVAMASLEDKWVMIVDNLKTFSKFKVKEKKSISSRAIFKYMDMVNLIDKSTKSV